MLPGCLRSPGQACSVRAMAPDGTLIDLGAPDSLEPIRVLLADDEPGLRTALTELLSHEDRVELIGTAADAEERSASPDLTCPTWRSSTSACRRAVAPTRHEGSRASLPGPG
jgi:hypothetical protein